MSLKLFAVNHLSETACASVRVRDNGSDNELIRPNNMKLEAFAKRIAWAFASIVVLLVIVSLLLVVAGYAGSRLALH
jgi:lipopolysaccharide/colanic/teichoic acid biosynthesis glycosyltransferase